MAVHISPLASNSMIDVRGSARVGDGLGESSAVNVTFRGDGLLPFGVATFKDGRRVSVVDQQGRLGITPGQLYDVDIYIRRNHVRITIDGRQVYSRPVGDIGFDRGYVYFAQLAYNPVKDGYVGSAANTFRWDNIAFDGPVLAPYSLVPEGQQDVMFRVFDGSQCTVRGVPAIGPSVPVHFWWTWYARVPRSGPPISAADIDCGGAEIRDVEAVY